MPYARRATLDAFALPMRLSSLNPRRNSGRDGPGQRRTTIGQAGTLANRIERTDASNAAEYCSYGLSVLYVKSVLNDLGFPIAADEAPRDPPRASPGTDTIWFRSP